MKKQYFLITILASVGLCLSSCKKEKALTAEEDPRSSYFLPAATATDEESVLRRTFYGQEKSYLLFNDTLRHEYIGVDNNGTNRYFTETVDLSYAIGTTIEGATPYTHELLETMEQKRQAIAFMKTYVLPRLGDKLRPYSWLLVKNTSTLDLFGFPNPVTAIANQRCIAVSLEDIVNASDDDKKTLANAVLSVTLSSKLMQNSPLVNKFYAISEKLYGTKFPIEDATDETNLEALNQRGFIVQKWVIEPFWASYGEVPTKEKDLESFIKLIFDNSSAEVNAQYANYPIVLQKYNLLKSVLHEIGYID